MQFKTGKQIEKKTSKTKGQFFEKIIKFTNFTHVNQEKTKEKIQINKIINE